MLKVRILLIKNDKRSKRHAQIGNEGDIYYTYNYQRPISRIYKELDKKEEDGKKRGGQKREWKGEKEKKKEKRRGRGGEGVGNKN